MLSKRDIRIIMLYEFKRGTNATKTSQNINEAFGEDVGLVLPPYKDGSKNSTRETRTLRMKTVVGLARPWIMMN
uniref:HTH_48 domain-containing protein n=1 Tax=Strongyloides stercoralis TaxID=6248 RepID=A0A0K0EMQ2_STRER